MSNSLKKRVLWIDAAKGFCILLVLLAHSQSNLFSAHYPDSLLTEILRALGKFFPCYMALFFFLSGYTFRNRENVLYSRFKSLMRPYLTWVVICIAYIVIYRMCSKGMPDMVFISKLISGAIYARFSVFPRGAENVFPCMPTGANPLWFLPCLFISYALFVGLIRLSLFKQGVGIIFYLLMGFVLSLAPILLPWSIDTAFFGALFIYAGYHAKLSGIFNKNLILSALSAIGLWYAYCYIVKCNGWGINMSVREYGKHAMYSPFLFIIIGLIGTSVICLIMRLMEYAKLAIPLAKLGEISLLLLCSHRLLYTIIDDCLKGCTTGPSPVNCLIKGNICFCSK